MPRLVALPGSNGAVKGFALQRAEIKELRAEQRENNKALGEKLDRLMESLLADKQP